MSEESLCCNFSLELIFKENWRNFLQFVISLNKFSLVALKYKDWELTFRSYWILGGKSSLINAKTIFLLLQMMRDYLYQNYPNQCIGRRISFLEWPFSRSGGLWLSHVILERRLNSTLLIPKFLKLWYFEFYNILKYFLKFEILNEIGIVTYNILTKINF